jgi:hypothetical protein
MLALFWRRRLLCRVIGSSKGFFSTRFLQYIFKEHLLLYRYISECQAFFQKILLFSKIFYFLTTIFRIYTSMKEKFQQYIFLKNHPELWTDEFRKRMITQGMKRIANQK